MLLHWHWRSTVHINRLVTFHLSFRQSLMDNMHVVYSKRLTQSIASVLKKDSSTLHNTMVHNGNSLKSSFAWCFNLIWRAFIIIISCRWSKATSVNSIAQSKKKQKKRNFFFLLSCTLFIVICLTSKCLLVYIVIQWIHQLVAALHRLDKPGHEPWFASRLKFCQTTEITCVFRLGLRTALILLTQQFFLSHLFKIRLLFIYV